MKISTFVLIICGLVAGILGLNETVSAAPDGSQRLRGLGDRVFMVTVELTKDEFEVFKGIFGVEVGTTFPNCYIFDSEVDNVGNNWSESAAPTVGFWSQNSVGAKTSYQVINQTGFEQLGQVTPARGKGLLQLEAVSTLEDAGLEFFSWGFEVQGTDILNCPNEPVFTLPGS